MSTHTNESPFFPLSLEKKVTLKRRSAEFQAKRVQSTPLQIEDEEFSEMEKSFVRNLPQYVDVTSFVSQVSCEPKILI